MKFETRWLKKHQNRMNNFLNFPTDVPSEISSRKRWSSMQRRQSSLPIAFMMLRELKMSQNTETEFGVFHAFSNDGNRINLFKIHQKIIEFEYFIIRKAFAPTR